MQFKCYFCNAFIFSCSLPYISDRLFSEAVSCDLEVGEGGGAASQNTRTLRLNQFFLKVIFFKPLKVIFFGSLK